MRTPKDIITEWGRIYRWDGGDATQEAAEEADELLALLDKEGWAIVPKHEMTDIL